MKKLIALLLTAAIAIPTYYGGAALAQEPLEQEQTVAEEAKAQETLAVPETVESEEETPAEEVESEERISSQGVESGDKIPSKGMEPEEVISSKGTESGDKFSSGDTESEQGLFSGKAELPQEQTPSGNDAGTALHGTLEVEMVFTLPVEKSLAQMGLSAELVQDGERKTADFISEEGNELVQKGTAGFQDLEPGTYLLEVTGAQFETYRQEIEIQDMNQRIQLVNTYRDTDMASQKVHPGVMGYGDLNRDGCIDDADKTKLLTALERKTSDLNYDLNGDGAVDLPDLQYLSYSYGFSSVQAAIVRTFLKEGMKAEVDHGQVTEGAIDDILNGAGMVQIEPAGGGTISAENPVQVSIDLSSRTDIQAAGFTIAPPPNSSNVIRQGSVEVEYLDENGQLQHSVYPIGSQKAVFARARTAASVTQEADGTIVVDLGSQIAVKRITIVVTRTDSQKLADIANVEFLNDMEERIPAPEMNVPAGLSAVAGDKEFTLNWKAQQNITGYEVEISFDGKTQVLQAAVNSMQVKSFQGQKLKNKEIYQVRVRSVNGEWNSGYCDALEVTPIPQKAPDAPENVSVAGGYRKLSVSWKKMEDTDFYTLYFREKGTDAYQSVTDIAGTKYEVGGLKEDTVYEVCLTGTNDMGTSGKSKVYVGTTTGLEPAITSNYKLLNTDQETGNATAHIVSVEYPANMPGQEFAVADNDYSTSWFLDSWDAGGFNAGKPSPIITFDQPYKMDRLIVIPDEQQTYQYGYAKTRYWDEAGNITTLDGCFTRKTSTNGKTYYEFNYSEPFTAKRIQVNFALGYAAGDGRISIGEMKFYYYDSLEEDVDALYEDGMHVSLAQGVTEEKIAGLETRTNTPDEVSGELHPRRELILRELENARKLLQDESLKEPYQVDTTVTKAKDGALGFSGGLNAWQPLGITVHEGEEIAVYVGKDGAAQGADSQIRLIAAQYHAESGKWNAAVVNNLKVGKNEVTIPNITSLDVEHGGGLYVEFTGNNDNLNISVRVSGGQEAPKLDISHLSGETERKAAVRAYVEELNGYVPQIEALHEELHQDAADSHCAYAYDKQNCILGQTDLVMDQMMYSVSSVQILQGIHDKLKSQGKEITLENQTEVLYQSLQAMDQMITLFYQHKGLADYGKDMQAVYGTKNNLPSSRLNIRYMRMFAGAFMYAGGLHIGIEWGSIPGLAKAVPVTGENGRYADGQLFGWGIAHEIGHIINQPSYAIAEITNNYFSILAQADETNEKVRFRYEDVYDKVTSGTKGKSNSVFTSLAMYWQLHLAYDNGYNYKTYDTYDEQFKNLFFARVDAYARNLSLAPQPQGIALTLPKDVDNTLMRLACAAAEKDLLEFFEAWGLTPDEGTIAYAGQFQKEERDICYITDEARAYRLEGGKTAVSGTAVQAELIHEPNSNQVTLKLTNNSANPDGMLGYEITRNGSVVGFVSAQSGETTFTDTIHTMNNRVVTYEVTGYDKLLNTTEKKELAPIKLSHDGSIGKENWSFSTNMTSRQDSTETGSDENPEPGRVSAIDVIGDEDRTTVYTGSAKAPEIIVNFRETVAVAGLKVTAENETDRISDYEAAVSQDGQNWTTVKTGTLHYENGQAIAYFDKEKDFWLYTYDASYLKLTVKNQDAVSLAELDVLGPSGDNVELLEDGIGLLKEDYIYDASIADGLIPKGSLIFVGEYKGNPAYNALKLYNQENELIPGVQVIFADVPAQGQLGEISSGAWVYYLKPEEAEKVLDTLTSVRAELYRVDDAQTNKGERLVSDTLSVPIPEVLPEIQLKNQLP